MLYVLLLKAGQVSIRRKQPMCHIMCPLTAIHTKLHGNKLSVEARKSSAPLHMISHVACGMQAMLEHASHVTYSETILEAVIDEISCSQSYLSRQGCIVFEGSISSHSLALLWAIFTVLLNRKDKFMP